MLLITVAVCLGLPITQASAAENVQYGGTLSFTDIYPGVQPGSLDAADWHWAHGYFTGLVTEHLMMADLNRGPRGTNEFTFQNTGSHIPLNMLKGELLEKWEVNKKSKPIQIVFHLRKGIMWQNKPGIMKARELVSDDVVHTINRAKASKRYVPLFLDWIDRVEAKGKHTVVLHLKEWNVEWPYYVAYGHYDAIQAPEQEKAELGPSHWRSLTGTGPFMLHDYKEGHSLNFVKNPNYWGSEVINKKTYKLPFVDTVNMMVLRDESTKLTALRTGKLDLVTILAAREMKDLKSTTPQLIFRRFLTPSIQTIFLRTDRKPLNDVRVRRALNMAIDRKALSEAFWEKDFEVVSFPATKLHTGVYTPYEKLPALAKEVLTYNPEKAKKLLAEAGFPNGFTFKLDLGNTGSSQLVDIMSMIAGMLSKIGVTMEINLMDYAASFSVLTKKIHNEAYYYNYDPATPLMVIRKNLTKGQQWNAAMMDDPKINEAWARLTSDASLSQKQVDAELKKLAIYVIEQAPAIMFPHSYSYCAYWPWVKNYYGEIRAGAQRIGPVITRIWIDQELKKKMGY